eukprot:SAG11_NODE_1258_length_5362_cov_16.457534_2_plen_86_part_00
MDWTPGADDYCSAECGRVFEPFWDSCGEMLTTAHMGGMEEMSVFCEPKPLSCIHHKALNLQYFPPSSNVRVFCEVTGTLCCPLAL